MLARASATILETGTAPLPWRDAPGSWPVLLVSAASRTAGALRDAGVAVGGDGALVLPDDLLVNTSFLTAFLELSEQIPGSEPLVAALGPSIAAGRARGRAWLGGADAVGGPLRVPLVLRRGEPLPADADALLALARRARVVPVDLLEQSRVVPVPRVYREPDLDGITFSATERVALHLTHRTHLLQANLDWLGATFLEGGKHKASLVLRYLRDRALRGGLLLSKVGKGCRIHRTALVEGCQLGAGVDVGAHAILRGCVLGDGVVIEDGAQAQVCVLGNEARLARQTALFLCVLLDGAHSSQAVMQASVLGRHAATTSDSWFADVRLKAVRPGADGRLPGRTDLVRVEAGAGHPHVGAFVDSGSRLLGCTVGHETVVGAGVVVAPGRSLPCRATILGGTGGMLTTTDTAGDDAGGGFLRVVQGRLERVDG